MSRDNKGRCHCVNLMVEAVRQGSSYRGASRISLPHETLSELAVTLTRQ